MTSTCPAGHTSESGDYCDVCGAPIGAPAPAPGSGGAVPGGSPAGGSGGPGAAVPSAVPAGPGAAAAASGSLLDLGSPGDAGGGRACPHCGAQAVPGALFCEDCGYDFTTGQLPRTDPPPLVPPAGTGPAPDAALTPPPLAPPLPADAPAATPPRPGAADPDPGPSGATPPLPPLSPPSPVGAAGPAGPGPDVAAVGPASTTTPGQEGPVDWVAEIWVDPEWHAAQEVTEPCPSPGMPQVVPLRGTTQLIGRRSASRNIHPQIDVGADTGVSRRHAQLTTDGRRWWVEDLQSSNGTYVGAAGEGLPDDPIPPGRRTELPDDARVYLGAWTRLVVRPATDEERASAG